MRVVGGHPSGNMRMRIRKVSWIQSKEGLRLALKPEDLRMEQTRVAMGRSGFRT